MLRPGNTDSNTAADHVAATRLALRQLPKAMRRPVLIRAPPGLGALVIATSIRRLQSLALG
jgi:hypothetical protein